jgi:hypothetical protein
MRPTRFQSTDTNNFEVERNGATKQDNIMVGGEEPVVKKAAKRTTPAVEAAEEPMAKPDDEKEDSNGEKHVGKAAKKVDSYVSITTGYDDAAATKAAHDELMTDDETKMVVKCVKNKKPAAKTVQQCP